jgi:hypothetical protein
MVIMLKIQPNDIMKSIASIKINIVFIHTCVAWAGQVRKLMTLKQIRQMPISIQTLAFLHENLSSTRPDDFTFTLKRYISKEK